MHRIETWFRANARDLPWRTTPRDPWASLVSEVMAQQTQIARVLERFGPFLDAFPTPAHLAAADEHGVLALWRGMGYYRRARLLHAAARAIVERHAGVVPSDPVALRALPGVGRYTAGAIASIALGQREPIVDGNVARVLLRVYGRPGRAGDPATDRWCWERAGALVSSATDPAALNEGLMELGALVCTPGAPKCPACPLRDHCVARRDGLQDQIPAPKPRAEAPTIHATTLLAIDARGRVLMEQRPAAGMWGGLWQAITLESRSPPTAATLRRWAAGPVGRSVLRFEFRTTHRLFKFDVRRATIGSDRAAALAASVGALLPESRCVPRPAAHRVGAVGAEQQDHAPSRTHRWLSPRQAAALPMSNPQHRIIALLLDPHAA